MRLLAMLIGLFVAAQANAQEGFVDAPIVERAADFDVEGKESVNFPENAKVASLFEHDGVVFINLTEHGKIDMRGRSRIGNLKGTLLMRIRRPSGNEMLIVNGGPQTLLFSNGLDDSDRVQYLIRAPHANVLQTFHGAVVPFIFPITSD